MPKLRTLAGSEVLAILGGSGRTDGAVRRAGTLSLTQILRFIGITGVAVIHAGSPTGSSNSRRNLDKPLSEVEQLASK